MRKQIVRPHETGFQMVDCDIDNITITSGSQQGLSMLAQIFINPGDVILVESPTYLGAINAFKLCKPEFVEVPTDDTRASSRKNWKRFWKNTATASA